MTGFISVRKTKKTNAVKRIFGGETHAGPGPSPGVKMAAQAGRVAVDSSCTVRRRNQKMPTACGACMPLGRAIEGLGSAPSICGSGAAN